jgi:hypothetical protein
VVVVREIDALELPAVGLDGLLVGVLPRDGDDEAATEGVDAEQQRADRRPLAGRGAGNGGVLRTVPFNCC